MKQLLAALQQRPTPDLNPEEDSSSELGAPHRAAPTPFAADDPPSLRACTWKTQHLLAKLV